jgi:hypothetical protein
MRLAATDDGAIVNAQRVGQTLTVLLHSFRCIAAQDTKVERIPGRRANTPMPGAYMGTHGQTHQRIKRIRDDAIGMNNSLHEEESTSGGEIGQSCKVAKLQSKNSGLVRCPNHPDEQTAFLLCNSATLRP